MAKIRKSSTSFKIFALPENARRENLQTLVVECDVRSTTSERRFLDVGTENQSSRVAQFPCHLKPRDSLKPTATPENVKVSSVIPNAPVKPSKKAKKMDIRPKRLQFMEEPQNVNPMNSGINYNETDAHRYRTTGTRCKICENVDSNSSNGKQVQPGRSTRRKNTPNIDKENYGNFAFDRLVDPPIEPNNRKSYKKIQSHRTSSKLLASQNLFQPEGDFTHFRI